MSATHKVGLGGSLCEWGLGKGEGVGWSLILAVLSHWVSSSTSCSVSFSFCSSPVNRGKKGHCYLNGISLYLLAIDVLHVFHTSNLPPLQDLCIRSLAKKKAKQRKNSVVKD